MLDINSIICLFRILNKVTVCRGNNDFSDVCRNLNSLGFVVFYNADGTVKAREEMNIFGKTVRAERCELLCLLKEGGCSVCKLVRNYLSTKRLRLKDTSLQTTLRTNVRFLTTQNLYDKWEQQRTEICSLKRKVNYWKDKFDLHCNLIGIELDDEMACSFLDLLKCNEKSALESVPPDSPQYVLWQQQKEAASMSNLKQMRWHPTLIRWCIALHAKSPAAYKMIKNSKFLMLPHECTLRDYTHFTTAESGSNPDVLLRIVKEHYNESTPEFKRNVCLLFDEVKIKSGLVYCTETGRLIGFCDLGTIGNDLAAFAQQCNEKDLPKHELATHMLTFMARGIFNSMECVFAHYPCTGFNSQQLYWVVWEAIGNLEMVCLKVRAIACDGATPNRKFYRLHANQGLCHSTVNLYDTKRTIYFICDVPHLIKTTRNSLENSNWHNKTRNMHLDGQPLQWTQIVRLVENDVRINGVRLLHRYTAEHLYLTPTLRMRVKLATQVLSSSTAHAFDLIGRHDTRSLSKFIQQMDTFFDCLNVGNMSDGTYTRKPAREPYKDSNDWRFEWLEKDFIGWLDEWESACQHTPHLTQKEKNKLCLSRETLEGIRITVKSFIKLAKELLDVEGVEYLLSRKLNQEPLESYFSKQRGLGGRCDNPTVRDFQRNALALQVAGSPSVLASARGNCEINGHINLNNLPLQRRKRHSR